MVFCLSLLLAVVTSGITVPRPDYIDWKVIACFFDMSAILIALEQMHVLDNAAVRILKVFKNERSLSLALVGITTISAMFITNDVALLTFVPLTLTIARKADIKPGYVIILQTLGANIGSGLTPIGNPQNLFLFNRYHISLSHFILLMFPFVLLGILWLWLLNFHIKKRPLQFELEHVKPSCNVKLVLYSILFILVVLSVFHILHYRLVTALLVLTVLMLDHKLLFKVDYCLLGTFICFFIFCGNLSHLSILNQLLHRCLQSSANSYFISIILSQFISNVPCAILLGHFTTHWQAVLLGVNIGGMGTLIASMASIISYRLYKRAFPGQAYVRKFLVCNFASLALLGTVMYYLFLVPLQ